MGKYSPEYQLSSRVATSQLKEPRVMKVDTRGNKAAFEGEKRQKWQFKAEKWENITLK